MVRTIRVDDHRLTTTGRPTAAALMLPVVAASGFAGLAYEIVWTRMFAAMLGTEMAAVLGVVTGFFAGLALGAFLMDRLLPTFRDARHCYMLVELVIGTWAVASIWLVPAAAPALAKVLGATPGPTLLWAAGFAFPGLLLLPATAAMGGTLVALERLSVAARGQPRMAAWVYGTNTAGAVVGVLAGVLVLMPALGLSGTLWAMALVNAGCAAGARLLDPAVDTENPPLRADRVTPSRNGGWRLTATLLATGLLGIAFEVLVVRLAAQVLQDTILSFAFLLAAYLLGTAAGSLLWQRSGAASDATAVGRLLAAAAAACLLTAGIVQLFVPGTLKAGPHLGLWAEVGIACALFLAPTAVMGALFGCLAQAVRDRRGTLGQAVGVNSLGAALAPGLASLVLLPAMGVWAAMLLVAAGYLVLGLLWVGRPALQGGLVLGVPAFVAGGLWLLPAPSLVRIPAGGMLLQMQEGATATASVVKGPDGTRYLEVNGHFRMGGTRSVRSDWRQAQVPLLLHPDPRRALFLGVGTGATLAGAAALPHVMATGVELTPEVVAMLPAFAETYAPPLPPVVTADARRFIVASNELYDVIVADLFHPALDGTGSLYTIEHFTAVRARLAKGGVFCQWLPLYQLDAWSLRVVIRTFLEAFPQGSGWLGNYSLQTPMLALCGGNDAAEPSVQMLERRLQAPAAQPALQRTGLLTPLDLLGLHLGNAAALAKFAADAPRNTDDEPAVTLNAWRNVQALSSPPATLLLLLLDGMTPNAAALSPGTGPGMSAHRLAAYRQARDRFIRVGAAMPDGLEGRALLDAAAPGLLEALRLSPEFEPAHGPLMLMAQALLATDQPAAWRLLHQIDQAAPSRGEARRLLARLFP